MEPYYQDDSVTLHHGDAMVVVRSMPDQSVDCIVTSPPYFGLRDYGHEGQYGLEESPEAYVETMRDLFSEARRVLSDDGTLWLNLGDSYSGSGKGAWGSPERRDEVRARVKETYIPIRGEIPSAGKSYEGLPAKNLMGIPWRVAFALQADGWILRNEIIWSKPNAMPSSVQDRLSSRHEHLFMFSKSPRYWFDLDQIKEPTAKGSAGSNFDSGKTGEHQQGRASKRPRTELETRNPGDVWEIPTQPFHGAHFATFPTAIPERCIIAGCKNGGTVLDPFSGSGTTGAAATKHGRKYIGVDLSSDYLDLSLKTRFLQPSLDLWGD